MAKRLLALLLTIALLLLATSALSENLFAEPVELIWYGNGVAGDNERVLAEMNAILKERYNTTIKAYYIGWTDWQSQYNLLLTSGEEIDVMYVNTYIYSRYAPSGAFTNLKDLFPKAMPETYQYFSEADLNEITVNGGIYAVPSSMRSLIPYGVLYRSDLMEKYSLEKIASMETFEAYMDAIVANEPELMPYNGNPSDMFLRMFRAYNKFDVIAGDSASIVNIADYDDISSIAAYPMTEEYLAWAHRMKDYAERGYWSSNALSSTLSTFDTLQAGASATSIENPDGVAKLITTIAPMYPSHTFDYWSFSDLAGYSLPNPVLMDSFAVPISSKNPERALAIIEAIKADQDLYDLWMYGTRGYHYELTEDGKLITPAPGQDASVSYNASSLGWAMRVESRNRANAKDWEGLPALQAYVKDKAIPNKYGAISLDYSGVQSELAAVNQVVQQYGLPINVGLVSDVDAAVTEYRAKLIEAGVERVVAAISEQVAAYCAEKGI